MSILFFFREFDNEGAWELLQDPLTLPPLIRKPKKKKTYKVSGYRTRAIAEPIQFKSFARDLIEDYTKNQIFEAIIRRQKEEIDIITQLILMDEL